MKSNVSDHLKLFELIYKDASNKCIADVSDLRDLTTVKSRVESREGFSFLTITLPRFCSDFEKSLEEGFIDSTRFLNFRKSGCIPAFLQGMISQLFDRETGRIYEKISEDAATIVEAVRQICLTFKKIEVECTPARVSKMLLNFQQLEQSVSEFSVPREDYAEFRYISSVLWDSCISSVQLDECRPKHGPGATAEHISGNQKYSWQRWHERLEPYFPIIGNGFPLGIPPDSLELNNVTFIPEADEQPVRVVTVPKTLRGPRIIAIEPCCMQFAQQGIRDVLYKRLESYWLTQGHVNFTDQTINQQLAMDSSISGQLATIDLSDASDRVPLSLAMEMFRSNPDLRDAIVACRSTRAELPDGTLVSPLKKFASMGSALCFPIEAMYFYTICVIALLKEGNLPVTQSNIYYVTRNVYVYGDDIVVPTTQAMTVLDYLRKYNCKVNVNKTFVSGSFRESCGVDAYRGYEVTPTYLRKLRPENRQQADRIISWVATANLFYLKGYWHTASFLFKQLERITGNLPYVSLESGGLGRVSYLGYRSAERWNRDLHCFEVKLWVPEPVYRTDELVGYSALGKSLLALDRMVGASRNSIGDLDKSYSLLESTVDARMCSFLNPGMLKNYPVSRDALHLEHSALHGAVALKRRWLPAT